MKKEQTNTTKKIVYLFLIVLVVVIGFLTISYLLNDNGSKNKFELKVYGTKHGYICLEGETICTDVVFTIPTETSNAKVKNASEHQTFLIISDNTLKVYNVDTKEIIELKLENKYDNYKLVTDTKDTTLIGIIYQNKNTTGFYNIKKDQKIYENRNFNELYQINDKYIGAYKEEENKNYLLSTDFDKIITSFVDECGAYNVIDDFILIEKGCIGEPVVDIYSSNLNTIAGNLYQKDYSISSGELHVIEDNQMIIYNKEGYVKGESKSYNKLLQVIDKYMIAVDTTNELIITDGKDLRIVITPWNEGYYYNWSLTEYDDKTITIFVEDNRDEESMDASGMKYRVNLNTKEVNSAKVEHLYQN